MIRLITPASAFQFGSLRMNFIVGIFINDNGPGDVNE